MGTYTVDSEAKREVILMQIEDAANALINNGMKSVLDLRLMALPFTCIISAKPLQSTLLVDIKENQNEPSDKFET